MKVSDHRLLGIWKQVGIPVVLRRGGEREKLRVRLPYRSDNKQWLRTCGRSQPEWIGYEECKYWEIPKAWFNNFVNSALKRFGQLYIIQPYREQEICARACMEATGHECQCSCMGANHGTGMGSGWFEVSEAFAVRGGERNLACRLLIEKKNSPV